MSIQLWDGYNVLVNMTISSVDFLIMEKKRTCRIRSSVRWTVRIKSLQNAWIWNQSDIARRCTSILAFPTTYLDGHLIFLSDRGCLFPCSWYTFLEDSVIHCLWWRDELGKWYVLRRNRWRFCSRCIVLQLGSCWVLDKCLTSRTSCDGVLHTLGILIERIQWCRSLCYCCFLCEKFW